MSELIALLAAAGRGDAAAAAAVLGWLRDDLQRAARARLRRQPALMLLDTTALLHGAYLRAVGASALPLDDRHRFFVQAARAMHLLVVELAHELADAEGGRLVLDTAIGDDLRSPENDVLRVHAALQRLERRDARLAQVVEMRYFAGLGEAEIAAALGLSPRAVRRDWERARQLLLTL